MLLEAQLGGLTDVIMAGIEGLAEQAAPSGAALNDQFKKTAKFQMAYGGLDVFFGGRTRRALALHLHEH